VVFGTERRALKVRLTNVSSKRAECSAHFPIILWIPHEVLPREEGYVRVESSKYKDWQVLAYEGVLDKELYRKEQAMYMEWLTLQPPEVEQ
jgi:hypothetical protein